MSDTLATLASYTQWANLRWLDHTAQHASADPYALKMLSHLALGERAWLQRLDDAIPQPVWQAMTLKETRELFAANAQSIARLLAGNREYRITFVRFNGDRGEVSAAEILQHLALHGAHHRGQLATHFARLTCGAPNTDFIEFCRQQARG